MIYDVTAAFKEETARLFLSKLEDGSIEALKPDGPEIVASMSRAVVLRDGRVSWTETCYCNVPLAHERETVLDAYFDQIVAKKSSGSCKLDGVSFMDWLETLSLQTEASETV
ncbi:MAG: hypothetical protein AAF225_06765 [Pseudomonadota bacterium]